MRFLLVALVFFSVMGLFSQEKIKFSTIEFIEVLNENRDEARYYYEYNWKVFREIALKQGKIAGFQLLETTKTKEAPFDFILVTSFANRKTFGNAEQNFQAIINDTDGPNFLNEKRPSDFRRSIAVKEKVVHIE